jgi:hypothetical protein
VEEARTLGGGRLAPCSVERCARRVHCSIDVGFAGHGRSRERLSRRRLDEIDDLTRGGLRHAAVNEEAVLPPGRHRHRGGRYPLVRYL